MNYIVTKPIKSVGIAAILALLLGPLGLFYATIWGGVIMGIITPILFVITDGNFLIFIACYFICLIWAVAAVDSYNYRIESQNYYQIQQKTGNNPTSKYEATNSNQQNFNTNSDNIIENLNEKKRLLFKDLDTITHLHAQKVLSDDVYNKQKDTLLKKLETLSYNEASISNSPARIISNEDYEYIPKEKKSYLFVWILFILLIGSLIYFFYTKGMIVFDNHKKDSQEIVFDINKKDREEITNQIEKTYFGIINGAYTAQGMQGAGQDGIPFYNMKMDNLIAMGFLPLMNFLSSGINLEAKNIDVYKFVNKNSANAKYDLVIEDSSKDRSDTVHIDMLVKKIGGNWKLDGQKAFGNKSKKKDLIYDRLYNNKESERQSYVKSISPYEAKQAFNNFINDYINKYERNESIQFNDIADNGSLVITESDGSGKLKSTNIDKAQFEKQIKKELYDDFKYIKEDGGLDSWELQKVGNKFVFSIDVNLTYYDFTVKIYDNILFIEKIDMFFDT